MPTTEIDSNKILLTLGCSFLERCWDDEKHPSKGKPRTNQIKDPYNSPLLFSERLSTLLAKEMGRVDVNLARSGQSNIASLDAGINYIKNHKNQDIKVLIGFTEFGRFNLENNITGKSYKVTPNWNTLDGEGILTQEEIKDLVQKFFIYYYNENSQINNFINRVITFHSYCKLNKIDPVYFFAYEHFRMSDSEQKIRENLYREFVIENNMRVFNFNSEKRSIISWPDYIKSYDDTYVRAHPIIDDNYKLLDLIRPYFIDQLI